MEFPQDREYVLVPLVSPTLSSISLIILVTLIVIAPLPIRMFVAYLVILRLIEMAVFQGRAIIKETEIVINGEFKAKLPIDEVIECSVVNIDGTRRLIRKANVRLRTTKPHLYLFPVVFPFPIPILLRLSTAHLALTEDESAQFVQLINTMRAPH